MKSNTSESFQVVCLVFKCLTNFIFQGQTEGEVSAGETQGVPGDGLVAGLQEGARRRQQGDGCMVGIDLIITG